MSKAANKAVRKAVSKAVTHRRDRRADLVVGAAAVRPAAVAEGDEVLGDVISHRRRRRGEEVGDRAGDHVLDQLRGVVSMRGRTSGLRVRWAAGNACGPG